MCKWNIKANRLKGSVHVVTYDDYWNTHYFAEIEGLFLQKNYHGLLTAIATVKDYKSNFSSENSSRD